MWAIVILFFMTVSCSPVTVPSAVDEESDPPQESFAPQLRDESVSFEQYPSLDLLEDVLDREGIRPMTNEEVLRRYLY